MKDVVLNIEWKKLEARRASKSSDDDGQMMDISEKEVEALKQVILVPLVNENKMCHTNKATTRHLGAGSPTTHPDEGIGT